MVGAELSKFHGGPVLTVTPYHTLLHSLSIVQVERVANVIKLYQHIAYNPVDECSPPGGQDTRNFINGLTL
jgi:hypothetical protein